MTSHPRLRALVAPLGAVATFVLLTALLQRGEDVLSALVTAAAVAGTMFVLRRPSRPPMYDVRRAFLAWSFCVMSGAALGWMSARPTPGQAPSDPEFLRSVFTQLGDTLGVVIAVLLLAGNAMTARARVDAPKRGSAHAIRGASGVLVGSMVLMAIAGAWQGGLYGPSASGEWPGIIGKAIVVGFWVGILPAILVAAARWRAREAAR